MSFEPLPPSACWRHHGLRLGFEVAYFRTRPSGVEIQGVTTGLQDGQPWIASYRLDVDRSWRTVKALTEIRRTSGSFERTVESLGGGRWLVDGRPADQLNGCWDVDLESSAMTNLLPVHRLDLAVGASASAPAAYVHLDDGTVERLDQTYGRVEDRAGEPCYEYEAPAFQFTCELLYDRSGLVVEYPGIATRAGISSVSS